VYVDGWTDAHLLQGQIYPGPLLIPSPRHKVPGHRRRQRRALRVRAAGETWALPLAPCPHCSARVRSAPLSPAGSASAAPAWPLLRRPG
jgi:hypothetical protein